MACESLKVEAVKHEKAQLATFKKRKASLMKKAYEITTLCDIEVCIIIYGPKLKGQSEKPETWTSNHCDLTSFLGKYKKKTDAGDDQAQRRTGLSLSKLDKSKPRKVNTAPAAAAAAGRAAKKNWIGDFTTWEQGMDSLSEDQLKTILAIMEDRLKVADMKLNMMRGDDNDKAMGKAASRELDHNSQSDDTNSLVNSRPACQASDDQKLTYDPNLMEILCGGFIPFPSLEGPQLQSRCTYEQTVSPRSSDDSNVAKKWGDTLSLGDQTSEEEEE